MALLTEEQTMLQDQARSWVSEQAPVKNLRILRDSDAPNGFMPETWSGMVQMGWTGIIVPEEYGGSGLGYVTFGLVLEETGRQLTASPLFASALVGASALLLGGSQSHKTTWLPKIVDGSAIVTLAVDEGGQHAPESIALKAHRAGNGFKLAGTKTFVLEGNAATAFIVAARTSGAPGDTQGITLFLVSANLPGVTRRRLKTADSRGYANVEFNGAEVSADAVLGEVDQGFSVLDATLDRARAGLAAEMLGTAVASFDMTLSYLKTRVQFGKVIGSFQALGHRAATLYTEMQMARSCVEAALHAAESNAKDVAQLCSLAKCQAAEFLHHMSNELIQMHGGIGMTDEFDAGLYLKRARAVEAILGNPSFHRRRYANLIGL
jgi:alkylation response protein AidB-like acyl-CoA dehydrogenase